MNWSLRQTILALVVALTASAPGALLRAQVSPTQSAVVDAWSNSLRVPGGAAALLAAAGLEPSRPRATALLDVIRIVHQVRPGIQASVDERRTALFGYLEVVAGFERARASFPNGTVSLAGAAQNKNLRKALEEFGKAIGCSLEQENRVYRLQPDPSPRAQQQRASLQAAGLDVAKLVSGLNKGEIASPALRSDEVPLVLPDAVWRSLSQAPDTLAGATVTSILGDRALSLVYYGAFSMDEETRRYLASTQGLLGQIHGSDRVGNLATCGQSLRVRGGQIEPPGGPRAVALWEAVADERVARPDRFILKVLDKDGGRLALLYDAIAHADGPHQAFALGLWMPDPGTRVERFKAFYSSCAAVLTGWDPVARPFTRVLYDPVQLLLLARVAPNGGPESLPWRKFWEKALEADDLPDRPENELKNVEKDGAFDAAWMIETVLGINVKLRTERVEAWLFGHRVFGDAPPASLPQVLVAVRAFNRFRALADTLERLRIDDPAVCVAAFRQAQRIAEIGDRERTALALASFQGGLSLIERARLSRVIDGRAAAHLVDSLSRLALSEDGEFVGGVAAWVDASFLPAIGRPAGAPLGSGDQASMETDVLAGLAGRRMSGGAALGQPFDHEGTRYRLDPSVSELARLQAIRAKQGGPSLDVEMGFAREVLAIARGIPDLAQIPVRVSALKAAAAPLLRGPKSDLSEDVADAVDALNKIKKPKDLVKAERIALPLRRAVDRGFARLLGSLAYACSLPDAESTALLAGDPSLVHDWGLTQTDAKLRVRAPWVIASDAREAGARWRMTGSLLALDVGMGEQALRRISTDALPDVPTVSDNDRAAFAEAVILANPFDYRDKDQAALADAIRRGRARVAVLASVPSLLTDVVSAAGLDETRAQALAWSVLHDRERVPTFFSLGDLLRLGNLPVETIEALDAWGTSGLSYDGRLCLRFPVSLPWTTLSGRKGKGITPTLVPDLALLVAEALNDQRLPAALTRSVLAVATRDYLDRVRLAYLDDWIEMVSAVQRIVPPRMDDYLAAVMTNGPLVPLSKGQGGR